MKKHFKRFMAMLLAAVMVFGAAPAAGFVWLSDFFDGFGLSAQAASESDLTFSLINGGAEYEVDDCANSASGELTIPATYNGKHVTSIGDWAFEDCTSLNSVTIGNSVTSIGEGAFEDCTSLNSVTIGNSVTSIGEGAFAFCTSLSSITIPDSVTSIGSDVFYNTALYNNQPDGIVYVGKVACDYKGTMPDGANIIIRDGTKIIANYAFSEHTGLNSITIPDSVTSIGSFAFRDCTALSSIIIPDSVTSIGDEAFFGCSSLSSVTIPDSVTSIGDRAFSNCKSLSSVTIGNGVKSIGNGVFSICNNLSSVTIGNGVKSIGEGTFFACGSLSSVTIPDSVTSIGEWTFGNCTSLSSVTIPDSVTSIGDGAFKDCMSLSTVTIPDSVTSIGEGAFSFCTSLSSVTIPDSVTSIGEMAFHSCTSLSTVTIGNSVTSIGGRGFYGCTGLISITIPDNVTSIGNRAFEGCTGLSTITIPDSVTSIDHYAFSDCTGLSSVTIPDSVTSIGYSSFYNCDTDLIIFGVPGSYAETYANDENITFLPITNTSYVTLYGEKEVCENTVFLYGFATPYATVDIFDGNIKIGSATASGGGKWSGTFALNNPVDGSTHSIVAKVNTGEENEGVSSTLSVKYNTSAVVFERIEYYHHGQSYTVTPETIAQALPVITIVPSYSHTFKVKLKNGAAVTKLYVVSTKDGVSKKIEAKYDSATGCWIATGWFDPANKSYVPGEISLEYNDGNKILLGYRTVRYLLDPSGFVYEAVESNTINGATATVQYKDGNNAIAWNADEYNQINPIVTPTDGKFAWDVPVGDWRVKVSKDGYTTATTEWMSVPPERTGIKIGLVTTQSPEIEYFNAYSDSAEIKFNQYMNIATVNADNITVLANGAAVTGTWAAVDRTETSEGSGVFYATTFSFTPSTALSGTVSVSVGSSVKNYAGLGKSLTASKQLEQKVTGFSATTALALDYSGSGKVTVTAVPAAAAAGKTVAVTSSDGFTLGLNATTLILNENGETELDVNALIPGTATISFALNDTNLTAKTDVTVEMNGVTLTSIAIATMPNKLNYFVGDTLDKTGLTLTATYSDGSTKTIAAADIACTPEALNTAGTQTITATYGGKSCTFDVTVTATPSAISVTGVTVSPTSKTLEVGATQQLSATIAPANATNKNLTWASSNTSIATVSANGLVTAKAAGTATITVTTVDGGKTATCAITVDSAEKKVAKIEILSQPNTVEYTYKNGTFNKAGLSIKVTYSSGTSETITDTSKIDVSEFNANQKGKQNLTVKYGGCETSITVTVKYSFVQWLIVIFLFGWLWY